MSQEFIIGNSMVDLINLNGYDDIFNFIFETYRIVDIKNQVNINLCDKIEITELYNYYVYGKVRSNIIVNTYVPDLNMIDNCSSFDEFFINTRTNDKIIVTNDKKMIKFALINLDDKHINAKLISLNSTNEDEHLKCIITIKLS